MIFLTDGKNYDDICSISFACYSLYFACFLSYQGTIANLIFYFDIILSQNWRTLKHLVKKL